MANRNSITHHATPADLTAGLVIGGGNAVAQLQDEALVVSLDGGVKFDYRADGASMTADNVYVVADAIDTTGKWVRKNVSSLLANVDVAYDDLADNTDTGTINVPVAGAVVGGAYVVGVTNAIGEIETTVYQVVADGILPIVFGNNTGAFLPAGTFNINVYKFAGEVGAAGGGTATQKQVEYGEEAQVAYDNVNYVITTSVTFTTPFASEPAIFFTGKQDAVYAGQIAAFSIASKTASGFTVHRAFASTSSDGSTGAHPAFEWKAEEK